MTKQDNINNLKSKFVYMTFLNASFIKAIISKISVQFKLRLLSISDYVLEISKPLQLSGELYVCVS